MRLIVIEQQPLFRRGIVSALSEEDGMTVIGEGATAQSAVTLAQAHAPDIVVMDPAIIGGGFDAIQSIATFGQARGIIAISAVDSIDSVKSAFKAGVRGYLLKSADAADLVQAVRTVFAGDICITPRLAAQLFSDLFPVVPSTHAGMSNLRFTEREEQILSLLSQGKSNKQMAFALGLSENTVKYYLTHLLRKLNVQNRVGAALFATTRSAGANGMAPAVNEAPVAKFED